MIIPFEIWLTFQPADEIFLDIIYIWIKADMKELILPLIFFLQRGFLDFYKSKGLHALSEVIIKERRMCLLDLPWKTTKPTNDSALFLMRHMETYMGNPVNLVTIGLQGVSVRILQILRGRYCKTMLLAPFNIARKVHVLHE